MKSKIFKSLAFCFLALLLWSCKKDETQTVSNITPAGTLTSSATSVDLVQSNGAGTAFKLTYPLATSSGYVVPVTSTLQFGLKGKNFTPAREVVVTTASYSPTISELNNIMLAVGGSVGTAAQLEVRLKSGASANDLTYSNVVAIAATPYLASAWIYVPGAYQGWEPTTADSLISTSNNGIYTGMIAFTTGNTVFKITPAKSWDLSYGSAGSGSLSTTGGDIDAVDAVVKQVTVDLNAKTYTIATPNEWSVIGDATAGGWNIDTDMKATNDGKSNFYTVNATLTTGVIKFRFAHDWGTNLGGSLSGLTNGGADIPVTVAGTYTITLDVAAKKATLVKN